MFAGGASVALTLRARPVLSGNGENDDGERGKADQIDWPAFLGGDICKGSRAWPNPRRPKAIANAMNKGSRVRRQNRRNKSAQTRYPKVTAPERKA